MKINDYKDLIDPNKTEEVKEDTWIINSNSRYKERTMNHVYNQPYYHTCIYCGKYRIKFLPLQNKYHAILKCDTCGAASELREGDYIYTYPLLMSKFKTFSRQEFFENYDIEFNLLKQTTFYCRNCFEEVSFAPFRHHIIKQSFHCPDCAIKISLQRNGTVQFQMPPKP